MGIPFIKKYFFVLHSMCQGCWMLGLPTVKFTLIMEFQRKKISFVIKESNRTCVYYCLPYTKYVHNANGILVEWKLIEKRKKRVISNIIFHKIYSQYSYGPKAETKQILPNIETLYLVFTTIHFTFNVDIK